MHKAYVPHEECNRLVNRGLDMYWHVRAFQPAHRYLLHEEKRKESSFMIWFLSHTHFAQAFTLNAFSHLLHFFLLVPTQMMQRVLWMVPQLCLCQWPLVLQHLRMAGLSPGLSLNGWTASRRVTCATRTLTVALVTGWCANALWARRRKPC